MTCKGDGGFGSQTLLQDACQINQIGWNRWSDGNTLADTETGKANATYAVKDVSGQSCGITSRK